jgi:hypothetical protein
MPNREFLEEYPLYRKFRMELPEKLSNLAKIPVTMRCENEGSDQTFNMIREYYSGHIGPGQRCLGNTREIEYQCRSCSRFMRYFMLEFGEDSKGSYVMKVGQSPAWDIKPDKELERILGDNSEFYKKALVCESQSYGIASFAYYRRIIEAIIDQLLIDIEDLIPGEEKEQYSLALDKAKSTIIAEEKISLVKDLLPPSLRPGGMNPLSVLYDVLSEGLHGQSDERCIELASDIRKVLEFLVNQTVTVKAAEATFTESMRRLLDRHKNAG